MTNLSGNPEPTAYYRERHTPSVLAVVAVFLICVAFMLGPVQFYSVVIHGDEPMWPTMILGGIAFGIGSAAFIAIYSYFTVVIVTDQAIRCLDRTVPLTSLRGWTLVEGKTVRRLRDHLRRDQGLTPIGMGIWALRGGRNKAFAPPWMPAGLLLETDGDPVLFGTRRPQQLLAAIHAARARVTTDAVRGDQQRLAAGPTSPPRSLWARGDQERFAAGPASPPRPLRTPQRSLWTR